MANFAAWSRVTFAGIGGSNGSTTPCTTTGPGVASACSSKRPQSAGFSIVKPAAPHDRARAEMLIADARQAVKEDAPMDRVQSLTSELQQVLYGLQPMPSGGGNGQPSGDGRGSPVGDDDVVDAEFDRG